MHIRQMYSELSNECKMRIEGETRHKESERKSNKIKSIMNKKGANVKFAKRKLELLQYDLSDVLRNVRIAEWSKALWKVYQKHFDKDIPVRRSIDMDENIPKTKEEREQRTIK